MRRGESWRGGEERAEGGRRGGERGREERAKERRDIVSRVLGALRVMLLIPPETPDLEPLHSLWERGREERKERRRKRPWKERRKQWWNKVEELAGRAS